MGRRVAWRGAMSASLITVPPEWAEAAALWVGWPHLRQEWGNAFEGARSEIGGFVRAAARYALVSVACGSDKAEQSARSALGEGRNISFQRIPAGDIWLRDTGPIIADIDGKPAALTFAFNGWGGKYVMPGDSGTASAMAEKLGLPERRHDFVLEGGAVEFDGAGRVLTTRECLLNPNRNPGWDEAVAEAALREAFSVSEITWLDRGLLNDHTDGHIDNLARFIGPGRVLCQRPGSADDPQSERLVQAYRVLQATGLDVVTIPSPGRILDERGSPLPASHMNYVLVPGALILPVYEDACAAEAIAELKHIFPKREIVPLPARNILSGGGAFHCMTREIPRHPFKWEPEA